MGLSRNCSQHLRRCEKFTSARSARFRSAAAGLLWPGRLQRIIPSDAECRDSNVAGLQPAFHFVMPCAVKNIGDADRSRRARGLETGESGRVVDDVVGDKYFLPSATF